MRLFGLCFVALAALLGACTTPQTSTIQPTAMQVSRFVHDTRPFCTSLERGGGLPLLFSLWMDALPQESNKNEVLTGFTEWRVDLALCDYWKRNVYQGLVFFNLDELPEGTVSDARLVFTQTRLTDPSFPPSTCFFKVGAITAPANWRGRATESIVMPSIAFVDDDDGDNDDDDDKEFVKGRDYRDVGPRENAVDVSRIVARWDLGVYPNLGFVFTPLGEDSGKDFDEAPGSCAYRVEDVRLEVTVQRPAPG